MPSDDDFAGEQVTFGDAMTALHTGVGFFLGAAEKDTLEAGFAECDHWIIGLAKGGVERPWALCFTIQPCAVED